jgi:hypothetical protein
MCNCIDKKIKDAYKYLGAKFPNSVFEDVEFIDVGYTMSGKNITYTNASYVMKKKKKDGTLGKGLRKLTKQVHEFCPFCGKPYSTKSKMKPVKP